MPGIQINRFCASGLDAVNFAAAEVMAGQHDMTIGGGVESMSRVGIGASGGAWPIDPVAGDQDLFHAAGHLGRSDRHQVRLLARRLSTPMRSKARSARRPPGTTGRFANSVIPVKDVNGITLLDRDEHMRPDTTMQSLAALKPSFVQMGELGGFDAVAMQRIPRSKRSIMSITPAIRPASSTARPPC